MPYLTDWCRERRIATPLLQMSNAELDESLRRFYAEARTQQGEEYSRSSLLGFRNAIERHFAANERHLKLAKNPDFQQSNKMLECKLKVNKRHGKENVQHKPVIESEDILKIKESPFLAEDNPNGLLRRVWFIVTLYWCRRGYEGQRELRRDSFQFLTDGQGKKYACMCHEELSKNHQGGISDKPSHEKETRLYSTGQDDDSYGCLQKYISKLNPKQEAFYQRPRATAKDIDSTWYENKPLGVNTLRRMMKEISVGAGLSRIYTNHCVRATAITIWSDAEVPARHIMSISGHSNEQSIASYNNRPSAEQLKNCSDILSDALATGNAAGPRQRTQPTTTAASTIQSSSSSNSLAFNSYPSGIFNACTIGHATVFVLPQSAPTAK